jgi:hypothetical protein
VQPQPSNTSVSSLTVQPSHSSPGMHIPIPHLVLLQPHLFLFCVYAGYNSGLYIDSKKKKPIELDVFVCCRQIPHDLYAEPHQILKFGCDTDST